MEKSWLDAIKRVLAESSEPCHYTEITEQILNRGYFASDSATPAAMVNWYLSKSIREDADKSPFMRVDKGVFTLKPSFVAKKANLINKVSAPPAGADDAEESIIQAFGMYWQRDLVVWRSEPKVFGKQLTLSRAVDFCAQQGIYILYDHHTVVYVGRSIDRPLGTRLFEHTRDRLSSRWNRFSWFGLKKVTDEGELKALTLDISPDALVATLEALLIETLEPPQNRKRGDGLSAFEYIQDVDPELKEQQIKNTLRSLEEKMRGVS